MNQFLRTKKSQTKNAHSQGNAWFNIYKLRDPKSLENPRVKRCKIDQQQGKRHSNIIHESASHSNTLLAGIISLIDQERLRKQGRLLKLSKGEKLELTGVTSIRTSLNYQNSGQEPKSRQSSGDKKSLTKHHIHQNNPKYILDQCKQQNTSLVTNLKTLVKPTPKYILSERYNAS